MYKIYPLMAGLALLLPAGVQAQAAGGQTPENAQAFLTKVVAAGGIEITAKTTDFDYGFNDFSARAGTISYPYGQVRSATAAPVASGPPCYTNLDVYGKYGAIRPNNFGGQSTSTNPLFMMFSAKNPPNNYDSNYGYAYADGSGPIRWNYVTKVEIAGRFVTLPLNYSKLGVRFHFPTEDLAKRVGFAMEVIRVACDTTADANF